MQNYDVIVVGSGPAGSTAAYLLARQRARVLLLEREKLPRYKPCGGGLTPKTVELLDLSLNDVLEDTVYAYRFSVKYRLGFIIRRPQPMAYMVMRPQFDHKLALRAVESGVLLHEGEAVTGVEITSNGVVVRSKQDTYQAQVVVGADGANSRVARTLGQVPANQAGVALEAEVELTDPVALKPYRNILDIDLGILPRGYGWIFPKAHHLSIGVGTFDLRMGDLRAHLDAYLSAKLHAQPYTIRHQQGHRIPWWRSADQPAHGERTVLVGDAAGLIDPLWGEGIYGAVKSAMLAAQSVCDYLTGRVPDLSGYSQALNLELGFYYRKLQRQAMYLYPTVDFVGRLIPSYKLKVES